MVSRTKANPLVSYLREKGYDATLSTRIPMKTTSIKAGIGPQGKNTLLIHPEYGPRLGLIALLTNAELHLDAPYVGDLCGDCTRCIDACPPKALSPYRIKINRCLAYASENPGRDDLPKGVRELEAKLVVRPTKNSYIECSICANVCPIGCKLRRAG
jgi:epoxyqueuosine reductase